MIEAAAGQRGQLALHDARSTGDPRDHLIGIEAPFGLAEQQPQDPLLDGGEERAGKSAMLHLLSDWCTHIGFDCTQYGYLIVGRMKQFRPQADSGNGVSDGASSPSASLTHIAA